MSLDTTNTHSSRSYPGSVVVTQNPESEWIQPETVVPDRSIGKPHHSSSSQVIFATLTTLRLEALKRIASHNFNRKHDSLSVSSLTGPDADRSDAHTSM